MRMKNFLKYLFTEPVFMVVVWKVVSFIEGFFTGRDSRIRFQERFDYFSVSYSLGYHYLLTRVFILPAMSIVYNGRRSAEWWFDWSADMLNGWLVSLLVDRLAGWTFDWRAVPPSAVVQTFTGWLTLIGWLTVELVGLLVALLIG